MAALLEWSEEVFVWAADIDIVTRIRCDVVVWLAGATLVESGNSVRRKLTVMVYKWMSEINYPNNIKPKLLFWFLTEWRREKHQVLAKVLEQSLACVWVRTNTQTTPCFQTDYVIDLFLEEFSRAKKNTFQRFSYGSLIAAGVITRSSLVAVLFPLSPANLELR